MTGLIVRIISKTITVLFGLVKYGHKDHEENVYCLKIPQLCVCKVKHEEIGKQKEVLRTCSRQVPPSFLIPDPHKEMNLCVCVHERETLQQSHTLNRLLPVQGLLFGTLVILQSRPAVIWCVELIMSQRVSGSFIQSSLMWKCGPYLQLSDLSDAYAPMQHKTSETQKGCAISQRIRLLSARENKTTKASNETKSGH